MKDDVAPVGVYDVECPKCGAQPSEPCWHLQMGGRPLMYPHIERRAVVAAIDRFKPPQ